MMLFATIFLMTPLAVSNGLLQDQGRTVQVAQAQPDKPGAAKPAGRGGRGQGAPSPSTVGEVRAFRLNHAKCEEASLLLNILLPPGIVVWEDKRTNRVLCQGDEAQFQQVQLLLETLDIPAEDARAAADLSIVPVRHRDVQSLANEIQNTLGTWSSVSGSHFRVAADGTRSAIILDGQPDAVARAKSIIKALDTPAGTAQLEFSFFRARLDGEGTAPEIPVDLRPVAEELRRFGQVELLGRLSTVATEEEGFQIEGMIANMIRAEVQGSLVGVDEDGSVKIKLDTSMTMTTDPQRGGDSPRFSLNTVIQAPRGEFIVLGSAPNGWKLGESAILVLHAPLP
jgi:hypothetical protein